MSGSQLIPTNTFATQSGNIALSLLDTNFSQVASFLNNPNNYTNYLVDSGGANAYVVTFPTGVIPSSYTAGLTVVMKVANANTGASTLNVNSLGAKNILTPSGSALSSGTLVANAIVMVVYDGTQFILVGGSVSVATTYAHTVTVYASGSGTYTTPANVKAIWVRLVGGGGGGGGSATSNASQCSAAAGGGGGGYAELLINSPSATYSYAVGAGGSGGSAGANSGTAGGTTTFSSVSATGGSGGAGSGNGNLTNCFTTGPGGAGGTGSGGNINATGGSGGIGQLNQGAVTAGGGGNSVLSGYSQINSVGTSDGAGGCLYGGGGSGAMVLASGAGKAGGAGAAGVIIITEYYV